MYYLNCRNNYKVKDNTDENISEDGIKNNKEEVNVNEIKNKNEVEEYKGIKSESEENNKRVKENKEGVGEYK